MTERPGMSGEPDGDPYGHLFRDEPPVNEQVGSEPASELGWSSAPEPTSLDISADEPAEAALPGAGYFTPPIAEAEDVEATVEPVDDASLGAEPVGIEAVAVEADTGEPAEEVAVEVDAVGNAADGVVVAADAGSSPSRERGPAETGRLFRSTGADPATGALPALRGDERRKLRTVGGSSRHATAVVTGAASTGDTHAPYEPLTATADSKAQARERLAERGGHIRKPKGEKKEKAAKGGLAAPVVPSGPGLRAIGVFVVVIAVTLLLGLVDVLIGPGLGPIFGVGLLGSSVYAALVVRRDDATYAVTAPPIAAFLAVITVGQLNAGASVDSLSGRAIVAFFALADNWLWVIGSTLAALVIVIVRGLRAKRQH